MAGGGAERVVSIIVSELNKYYNIHLVILNGVVEYQIPSNIPIICLDKSGFFERNIITKLIALPIFAYKYYKLCKEKQIDISFSLLTRSNYINILSKKLFSSTIKTIVNERGTPSLYYGSKSFNSILNKRMITFFYPYADSIITNAKGNRKDLERNFQLNNSKLSTLYNPVDYQYIIECTKDEIDTFDSSRFTFVTVGRLDKGKNHELILKALKQFNDAQLIIIGKGELYSYLIAKVKEYKLIDRVQLIGFDSNPFKYLIKSDCFVFTSNYEGFPNVLAEALCCNLPIISTDCTSGPREILMGDTNIEQLEENMEIGEYGILIPPNNLNSLIKAMDLIMDNNELRNSLKDKSTERVLDFSKEIFIKNVIKVINK